MPKKLHYIFDSSAPQSPAKPLQDLIVLKKNAAHCRRWVLLENTTRADQVQCSQAVTYFDLENVECALRGLPDPGFFVEVLFPPYDDSDRHYDYVEEIYGAVQGAWDSDAYAS